MSKYREQIDAWLKKEVVFTADQVLDVGGGDKQTRSIIAVNCNNYIVMDNDPATKPDILHDLNEFKHGDDILNIYQNPRADLIFCLNVFEYINRSYNAMANLYTWLSEDGTLVVNFPFLYPIHLPKGIDYSRYTHEWVHWIFHERFKFKEIEVTIIQATAGANLLRQFYNAEGMHMRKNDDSWLEIGTIVKAVK